MDELLIATYTFLQCGHLASVRSVNSVHWNDKQEDVSFSFSKIKTPRDAFAKWSAMVKTELEVLASHSLWFPTPEPFLLLATLLTDLESEKHYCPSTANVNLSLTLLMVKRQGKYWLCRKIEKGKICAGDRVQSPSLLIYNVLMAVGMKDSECVFPGQRDKSSWSEWWSGVWRALHDKGSLPIEPSGCGETCTPQWNDKL